MVKVDDIEEEEPNHHQKSTGVVRKSSRDESFELIVAKRTNSDNRVEAKCGESLAFVVDGKFIDTAHIRHHEGRTVVAFALLNILANVRVHHDELKLNVISLVWYP